LKATLLVDTATNAVLDGHVTTTREHDTRIAPQVVKRNVESSTVLTGDRGYDDQKPRRLARECDIRPVSSIVSSRHSTRRGTHDWTLTSIINGT
jgi:IS5 family transposase